MGLVCASSISDSMNAPDVRLVAFLFYFFTELCQFNSANTATTEKVRLIFPIKDLKLEFFTRFDVQAFP